MDAAVAVVVHGAVDVLQPLAHVAGAAVAISRVLPTKYVLEIVDLANSVPRPFMYNSSRPAMPGFSTLRPSKLTSTKNSPQTPNRPLFQPRKSRNVAGSPNVFVLAPPTVGK